MRIIICAAGDATGGVDRFGAPRWANEFGQPYLGAPKHMIEIDGETLLERTVRLLGERGVRDITITGPDDDRYRIPGANLVTLENAAPRASLNAFFATRPLWNRTGRTILLFGDVFYTDDAMDTIVRHQSLDYHVFRRPRASKITGHRWDEPFAISFGPAEQTRVIEVAERLVAESTRRVHIWAHLAAMQGVKAHSYKDIVDIGAQTHIDDFTDDFDSPADYRRWVGRYHAEAPGVVVCVPWIPEEGNHQRFESREFTRTWWEALGVPVIEGSDPTGGRWPNRSAARNDAARKASEQHPDWQTILFADSDTFVLSDQLWAAAHLAKTSGKLVLAFNAYYKLNAARTRLVLRGRFDFKSSQDRKRVLQGTKARKIHASGAIAVSRTVWEGLGGFDERFASWGCEDRAFWCAARTLFGVQDRIDGPAIHLFHARAPDNDRDTVEFQQNIELGKRYKAVAGVAKALGPIPSFEQVSPSDPDAMRALLGERGGPLDGVATTGSQVDSPTPRPTEMACDGTITRGPNRGQQRRGTKAGFDAHRRAGQTPCDECANWRAA